MDRGSLTYPPVRIEGGVVYTYYEHVSPNSYTTSLRSINLLQVLQE